MTAFDRAWAIVKMPIVPGSLRNTNDEMGIDLKDLYEDFWEAQFEDPETGEIIPMKARTTHGPGCDEMSVEDLTISADMWNPHNTEHDETYDQDKDEFQPFTAKTSIQPDWGTQELSPSADWFPQQSNTQFEHRRKGYMTALYNMVQAILQREKWGQLLPSSSQSHQAGKFWDAKGIPDTELKPGSHKAQQQILAEHLDWDNYDPPLRWPNPPEELWQKEE